jgi:hypothetical protein
VKSQPPPSEKKELLDHAWRHFEFHAQQRLSLFNFYIVLCGLLVAAWATAMTATDMLPQIGVFLGALLAFFSFSFWKMDERNADLTKRAERLMEIAEKSLFDPGECLFCEEEIDRPVRSAWHLLGQWSHGTSLRVIFSCVGLLGIASAAYAAASYCDRTPTVSATNQVKPATK